ncbi:MAG: MipA/OmpV family protein [Bacteriovoracaceae bacterium]|nr:MipA/OmpV family protein [Bacteriovoracaceae bacterium]
MKFLFLLSLAFTCLNAFAVRPEKFYNPIIKICPLYELGIGVFHTTFPHYPGAESNRKLTIPFPSAIYRGDILRAKKDEGIRGRFLKSEHFELDVSFDGTFQSSEKHNEARKGMPDLDTVIEFGPKLTWHVLKPKKFSPFSIDMNFAIRYIFSSDIQNWNDRGLAFNPFLSFKYEDLFKDESLLMFSINAKFATQKLHHYYYGVDKIHETNTRPVWHAKSGYMETSTSFATFWPIKWDIWIFGGIIQAFYNNAKNKNSPLHARDETTSIIVGFYWNFLKSKILVID